MKNHNPDTPLYSIGTVVRMLGVSAQTLRMYESEGLLAPYKTDGNQRLYSDADVERLECIRKAINLEKISIGGMKKIHSMIPCWNIMECPEEQREKCPAFKNQTAGCWTYNHEHSLCGDMECRVCKVYKLASHTGYIKEQIIKMSYTKDHTAVEAARDHHHEKNNHSTHHHGTVDDPVSDKHRQEER
ncbi:MAG: MerR family transcriptional regulator [Bacteroidota bacterium]|nr:MerR family transcriptional regulator [Bacteroidota bacterium]